MKKGRKFLTVEEFIRKARKIHGDKYDYSKVEYKGSKVKVCIICPIHGEFWQRPNDHLKGHGCPDCGEEVSYNASFSTTEHFIKKSIGVHGIKYDYSNVDYKDTNTDVCIICPIHGEFWQKPRHHLSGCGCKKCACEKMSLEQRKTKDQFIKEANKVHNNKYGYSNVDYVNSHTEVLITCPIHGDFPRTPHDHLKGSGCPICSHNRTKQYKFNLLEEFESEYDFRAFLANNDTNILQVILRNIEPKFEPIKQDIEKALAHSNEVDPIKALRDKYSSKTDGDSVDELDADVTPNIDLDDDDAIDSMVTSGISKKNDTITVDEVIKNTEREIKVINKIEHMLTPEDREYIMSKFLNDKRRTWIFERENSVK